MKENIQHYFNMENIIQEIKTERLYQDGKWGIQLYAEI